MYKKSRLEAKVIYLGNKLECVNYHKNMKVDHRAGVEKFNKKVKNAVVADSSQDIPSENNLDSLSAIKWVDQKAVLIQKIEEIQKCLNEKSLMLSNKERENAELIEANKTLRATFSKFLD